MVVNEYEYMFPHYCYPVGFYNSAIIYIDSELSKSSTEYLFWQSCIDSFEAKVNLCMNFETWLEKFIESDGNEFWL